MKVLTHENLPPWRFCCFPSRHESTGRSFNNLGAALLLPIRPENPVLDFPSLSLKTVLMSIKYVSVVANTHFPSYVTSTWVIGDPKPGNAVFACISHWQLQNVIHLMLNTGRTIYPSANVTEQEGRGADEYISFFHELVKIVTKDTIRLEQSTPRKVYHFPSRK